MRTLERRDLQRLKDTFQRATKTDRFLIRQELLNVMIKHGEATDNSTHLATRMTAREVQNLEHLAEVYDTTVAEIVRSAVRHYVADELSKRPKPHRTQEDA